MIEILRAEHEKLTVRAAELESLIAKGEKQAQAIAADANTQLEALGAQAVKHAEELAGVRHSTATLDALLEQAQP